MNNNYLQIGEIYREHGIKGFCKAHIYSGVDDHLDVGEAYTLTSVTGQKIETKLAHISVMGKFFLLHFAVFKSPEEIQSWRKAGIWISKSKIKRDDDEMYDFEWQGFKLYDQNQTHVGVIREIVYTPLRQFVVIKESGDEIFIPCQKEWIVKKDDQAKTVVLNLPEGILEL